MSILNLNHLFAPSAVAVIGASERPRSVGAIVMRNLLDGGFSGPIMPVNPKRRSVAGVLAYPRVEDLPVPAELALLCVPGALVPGLVERLGRHGTRAAIVSATDGDREAMLAAAKPHGLRLLGGGSLGVLAPRARLNASAAHLAAVAGRVAFVSQSGALCTAVLDWARPRGIGFSYFVSLGEGLDVDFGDMLDFLANDEDTKAILLYVESIAERRDFMAATRAAARNKPVILVKAGRGGAGRPIGPFLSETLASPDDVFEAAARRAGALRVARLDQLFGAVETLARSKPLKGERLAVLSNGGGTAMMAVDAIVAADGRELAALAPDTIEKLSRLTPHPGNPVDLGIAAPAETYAGVLGVLAEAAEVDATLVIHAPNPMVDGTEAARAVIAAQKKGRGAAVLTCWIGAETAGPARRLFAEAGLPAYETIADAVDGFHHLIHHQRNQDMLLETPPLDPEDHHPARGTARLIVERALSDPEGLLGEPETRALLAAYGIPVIPAALAASADEAAERARAIGFPVALTVASPDVARKWDVGGVALNLENAEAVRAAAAGILRRVRENRPDARIDGFAVQSMALRPHARQLMLGIACDPLFGPVLVFGEGGRAVELVRDHTVALPPVNMPLARQVIDRTRVSRRLDAQGARPAANREAVAEALVRLSCMLVDNPEIVACDINPLFADELGVLAVDARIRVAALDHSDQRRFAILPYPAQLEETATLHDGQPVLLRPIRPADEPAHAELIGRVTPQDLRYRFFGAVRKLQHHQLARLTQIDYDREMAFIAIRPDRPDTLGVVRTVTDPDNRRAELAILVRSDLKGTGLGTMLMTKIIDYHKARGTGAIVAQILAENAPMLRLARRRGFSVGKGDEPDVMECVLRLS